MTLPEIEAYVWKLVKSAWFQRRWSIPALPQIEDGRGSRRARGGMSRLQFPRWSRYEMVVLHELAHFVTIRTYGHYGAAAHGREYCAIYLELVEHMMGTGAAADLRDAFKAHGVKYKPKRELSPERREALREHGRRLAAARNPV